MQEINLKKVKSAYKTKNGIKKLCLLLQERKGNLDLSHSHLINHFKLASAIGIKCENAVERAKLLAKAKAKKETEERARKLAEAKAKKEAEEQQEN